MAAKIDTDKSSNVTERQIEAADGLVRSTMVDQASDIEHGWREGYQNIVDSDATEGRLKYTHELTKIADNGPGVDLTGERGIDLLTNMGETSKDADDHSTVGEFGIGKGQINAKGQAVWISGNQALLFDIKNFGLTVKQTTVENAADVARETDSEWADLIDEHFSEISNYSGLAILVKHYEDEVPDKGNYKWDRYEERIKDRFGFLESVRDTKLYFNGDRISNKAVSEAVEGANTKQVRTFTDSKGGDIHTSVKHNVTNSLKVYSGGIYVKDVENRGLAGAIVTENNLRLNFARNEIKSGCPIWSEARDLLDDMRGDLFETVQSERLNSSARKFVASQIFDDGDHEEYGDMEIFKTTDEDLVSLNQILDSDEIGIASKSNPAADALTEAFDETVLAEHDDVTEKMVEARDEANEFSADGELPELPDSYDAQDRAADEGLHIQHEDVPEHELTPTQMNHLGVARLIADKAGIDMKVSYGKSDAAQAWTDGRRFIKITDDASSGGKWQEWVPSLWLTMMHEVAHKWGDKDDASHGRRFNRRFREKVEENETTLPAVMREISAEGLGATAEKGHESNNEN